MENVKYTEKLMKNFMHPKNIGQIKDADAIGVVGNPQCGDVMKLYLKIERKKIKGKEKEYIKDIKFQTFGCAAAIGTSSMITQLAKGKTIDEAEKITNKNIACSLGGLPNIKMHCSNLAEEGLKKAIANYKNRKGGK